MRQPGCFGVLNHDPLVIHTTIDSFSPLQQDPLDAIDNLAGRPYALVVQVGRALGHLISERPNLCEGIAGAVQRHEAMFPQTRVWFACGTPADLPVAKQHGLRARVLYPHAFVNDLALRLRPLVKKKFDAMLIAPVQARERHELAALIEAPAIIAEPPTPRCSSAFPTDVGAPLVKSAPAITAKRRANVKQALPHAYHADYPAGSDELSNLICRARAGLCLGDHDVPSPEPLRYWLSGLPVVSTAGPDSRDPLYDASRAIYCAATPAAVANAVSLALARDFDPVQLRRGVLTRLWTCRNEWRQFMAQVCVTMGHPEGNRFEDQFKALRDLDTGLNLPTLAALARVIATGSGVADPAPSDTPAAD